MLLKIVINFCGYLFFFAGVLADMDLLLLIWTLFKTYVLYFSVHHEFIVFRKTLEYCYNDIDM